MRNLDLNDFFRKSLTGKKVLVTGGTTGIGREIALLLSSFGADCMVCGRHPKQIEETLDAVKAMDVRGSCKGFVADLSSRQDITDLFKAVDEQLGGLDILINNAALGYGSVMDGSHDQINYLVQTNLVAYLICTQEAIKRMDQVGVGHILNIGSMSADTREMGSSVYVATKSGIQGFSEALRKEINPKKIKVTLIEPGAVDTDMQPGSTKDKYEQISRFEMLPAEDIALAVAFALAQHERCDIVALQIRPHLQLI